MSLLNNPAGRLYLLFEQLLESSGDVSIQSAWGSILGIPSETVGGQMGKVAALVTQIDEAVSEPGRERIAMTVNRYRPNWLLAAQPFQFALSDAVTNIRPSPEAFEALGVVAELLGQIAPDESEPSEEERERRLDDLRALREEVRADEELPERVRHLIVERLTAVEAAIEHINIGGSEAVQHALEALLGAALATTVTNEKTAKSKIIKKVMSTAGVIWVVFTSGPTAQQSIEMWTGAYNELTSGPVAAQTAAAQPTPSPSPPEPPPDQAPA